MNKKKAAAKRQYRANHSLQNLVILAIVSLILIGLANLSKEKPQYVHPEMINFSAIKNVQLRQQTFIDFLVPKIKAQNEKIADQREQIKQLIAQEDFIKLCEIAKNIHLSCESSHLEDQLLKRINQIPLAIVLSQAILESGWGTSRFSEQGLSLFGVWCFSNGCGIVPSERDEDKNHEIRSYASVSQSIEDYYQLINHGSNFENFRLIRANQEEFNSKESVMALTRGLTSYSGIDAKQYIERVRKIILSEGLLQYN